jgi:hypothetical protein
MMSFCCRGPAPDTFDPEFKLFQSFIEGYISPTTPHLSAITAVLFFLIQLSAFTWTSPTQLSVKTRYKHAAYYTVRCG